MTSPTEQQAGDLVAGRYQLQRVFAKGGMGSVWVALDRKLRREVAVKLLAKSYVTDTAARTRFEREAMSVAKLSSPHVVQVFDYGVENGTPFIVMELLIGQDLRRRLMAKKVLNIHEMFRIVAQVCAGLVEAHNEGVIHRDLKPANIFLTQTKTGEIVKLLDFGVAKPEGEPIGMEPITGEGSFVGTPQYMSPEQIRALPCGPQSDLFSLGVIIYRCLVGRLPFEGKTLNDFSVNIATQPVPPPSSIHNWLTPDVDQFMARALAKDPAERYASAREMADAFGSLIPGSQPGLDAPSLSGALLRSSASWPGPPSMPSYSGYPSEPSLASGVMDPISLAGSDVHTSPTMSNTAQAAILAAAESELAMQNKTPWRRRAAVFFAVFCVVALCIGIGAILFDGSGEPRTETSTGSGTNEVGESTPEPEPEPAPEPEPVETTPEPPPPPPPPPEPTNEQPKKAQPPSKAPPQPPVAPPPQPPNEPWDPFKNRK